MELTIKGKPEEIKNVLQAIGSSKEYSEIENTVQHALSTANYALSLAQSANLSQISPIKSQPIKSQDLVTGELTDKLASSKDA